MATFAITSLIVCGVSHNAYAQLNTITQTGSVNGINSGFGNVIGSGATLTFDQANPASSVVNITFQKGPGGFNDVGVLYLATSNTAGTGFNSTATLTDTLDGGRRAASGFSGDNRSTLNFATGFTADFALSFENGFTSLYRLNTGTFDFIAPVSAGVNTANGFSYNLDLALIGLTTGQSFDYVGTYLNQSNSFRSNEFIGVASFGDNPGQSTVNLPANNFNRFVSVAVPAAVPEAGALPLALSALSVLGAVFVTRRQNAK
jgi:hypothetical protein